MRNREKKGRDKHHVPAHANLFVLVTHCFQHFFALMLSNLPATFFPEVSHDDSLFNLMFLKRIMGKFIIKSPKCKFFSEQSRIF